MTYKLSPLLCDFFFLTVILTHTSIKKNKIVNHSGS